MSNELENLVFVTLDRIVQRVLDSRPTTTDGKPLDRVVYSHLTQGILIDPETYRDPWVPSGPTVAADGAGAVAEVNRGLYAAWRTAELTNDMLMVTTDGSYTPYRSGRHLDFQYKAIITEMQPEPAPPVDPAVQKRIDEATKLLYELDDHGQIVGKTKLYKTYLDNADRYGQARADFTNAQAEAQLSTTTAALFPQTGLVLKAKVDRAWNDWRTEGAVKVEGALNTIEAQGGSITEAMVAKARADYAAWDLLLAGVPVTTPYVYIEPSNWCDPAAADDGWEGLHVTSSDAHNHVAANQHTFAQSYSQSHSSSTSGGGQVGYAFLFVGADAGSGTSEGSWGSTASGDSSYQFHNDGSNFTVDLQWAMLRAQRPWLNTDLFTLRNWYLVGEKKNGISDGTIEGQALKEDPLMPMIPMDYLAIRNVRIHSSNWGSDRQVLSSMQDSTKGDFRASTSSYGGSAGVSLGFITFGGHVSHSESDASAHYEAQFQSSSSDDWGWHFDGATLEIRGVQIVGVVSTVTPPCPSMDAPAPAPQS